MPLTPNAVSQSFVRHHLALLALGSTQIAFAQPDEPPAETGDVRQLEEALPGAERGDGETTETPPEPDLPRAQFTSIGRALSPSTLEPMLGAAIQSSFEPSFDQAHHFEPKDLFLAGSGSNASFHVWVDTRQPGVTRIYFAHRDRSRYLVRELQQSRPLSEMDREAIAQTIEWSLSALSEGTAGLTRAEAEALLSESAPPEDAVQRPPPPVEPTREFRSKTGGWLPEVSILHGWAPYSDELMKLQGPMMRLAVDHLSARHQLGMFASGTYLYPQRHAQDGVALELDSVGARLGARYLALGVIPGAGLGLELGFGIDVVSASPEALDWDRFSAAEKTTNVVPLLHAGSVWQFRVERGIRLELGFGIEVDLTHLDYDVTTADETLTLLSRWPARPTARVGVALF